MPSPLGGAGMPPLAHFSAVAPRESALTTANETTPRLSFQDVLLDSIEQVNQLDRESQAAVAEGLTGGDLTQAEVLTSMKKADLAFRTMLQIRNKLVEAYNEVKNMRM